ncbi:MAG: HNH endonuclease [Planctomycetota bacterium]
MKEVKIRIYLPECIYRLGIWAVLFYRKRRYGDAFRIIPLTKGLVAIVSPEDYERVAAFKWYADKHDNSWYANRWTRSKANPKKQYRIRMHREILCPPDCLFVDHRNHNGLDNRRSNLRIATLAQNGCNKRKTASSCTSRFKGVCWWKKGSKWRAQGRLSGKQKIIGYFDNELDAAKAYDAWAKQAFGQFAALNFPQPKTDPLGDWSFKICYGQYTG